MNEAKLLVQVAADGSGFRFNAADRRQLERWKGAWVVIRRVRRQRSLDQNAYLHAEVFPKIAAWMGDDIKGAKLALMGECFGWKRDPKFGRELPVKPDTSSMTVEECSYFIDWVIPWAAQHCVDSEGRGLQILLPGEWQATHEG